MFSSLNNLRDLTLWEDYAAICGFTVDDEFDALFGDRLGVALERLTAAGALSPGQTEADLRDAILEKYDGYSWDGRTRVLNPWSVLSFFLELYFGDFWVTTGQPSHLIKLLKRSDAVSQISICIDNDINAVDIESFNQEIKPLSSNITVLMFQAGYLTVNNVYYKDGKRQYLLKIPNNEVNSSLIQLLIGLDSKQTGKIRTIAIQSQAIAASIANKDPAGFIEAFSCFLDVAPYHDHEPWEGYYLTSLLYALLFAGAICNPEGAVGGGRYDLHMRSEAGDDYIIEVKRLKKDDTESAQSLAAAALEQIELKRYASMFKGGPGRVFKVAVVVSDRTCVLAVFEPVDNWTLATLADGTRKVAKANPA
jgi:hypothetical protein